MAGVAEQTGSGPLSKKKPTKPRPPSIVDLAAELGVSHMTISRVINDRPGVSAELAARIRQRMRDLGYQPREVRPGPRPKGADAAHANGTAGHRRGTIGFVQLSDGHTRNLPAGTIHIALAASQAAARAGHDMLFAEVADQASMPGWLREGRVDGLLLSGYQRDNVLLESLCKLPCVWLSSHPSLGGSQSGDRPIRDRVLSGNRAAGKMAADFLVRRGHQRVAFLNPIGAWQVLETRGDAFDLAARRGGATVTRLELPSATPDEVIFSLPLAELEGRVATLAERLAAIPKAERPTGIFLADAPVALAFYRVAPKAGLTIGAGGLDPISFGHHPGYAGLTPMPAYVGVPESVRGARAVNQLLWRIAHPDEAGGIEVAIDPEVVEGETPPPSPRP